MIFRRRSTAYLFFIATEALLLCLFFIYARHAGNASMPLIEAKGKMVRDYDLTDLCLFTEARYTRNITQTDLHTPFQDYPLSFDHFPSAAFVPYPDHLKKLNRVERHDAVD